MRVFHASNWKFFVRDRWLVFVCSMWVQSFAGISYMFGSISPVIKSSMGYNQSQVAILGVAKTFGDTLGSLSGYLCEVLPIWCVLLIGAVQSFVGYGVIWLVVVHVIPTFPFWALCILVFTSTNGETYYNTANLVSSVQNFPRQRGLVVGILKGFVGLSGAIMLQIYALFHLSQDASLILIIALVPSIVVVLLMFMIRPVNVHNQARPSDNLRFFLVYVVCFILAAYLLGVILLEDFVTLSPPVTDCIAILSLALIIVPIAVPVSRLFTGESLQSEESLLPDSVLARDDSEIYDNGMETHINNDVNSAQGKGYIAVGTDKSNHPQIGDDFTLLQALKSSEFWLLFMSILLGSGSGVTVFDNMGQISQSLGHNPTIYVSMISIWNFLGRLVGGYCSELSVKRFKHPRLVSLAVVQAVMAVGFAYYAFGFPGEIYVLSVMAGFSFGAEWAVAIAALSELFGLRCFGSLLNILTLSMPMGSLLFSGVIAGGFYDYYAKKQLSVAVGLGSDLPNCVGIVCYSNTFGILCGLCAVAVILTLLAARRTRGLYTKLYSIDVA